MTLLTRFACVVIVFISLLHMESKASFADDKWLLFSDSSISLLTGTEFELPGDNVSTLTLEHVSGWKWGDLFIFADALKFHSNPVQDSSWYGEFSPRFSLGKLAGLKFNKNGLVRDILISTTFERGKNGNEGLLIGGAVDLNIPGFQFFKLNAYARKDTSRGAGFDDMQWTLGWAYPIELGTEKFRLDGFVDYVVGWGPQEPALHTVTQIKWDIGHSLGLDRKIYLGSEIDIWDNQFGVKNRPGLDTNQIAVSALLKVHF